MYTLLLSWFPHLTSICCCSRSHTGCNKEFNRPDKLKAHILSHSGEWLGMQWLGFPVVLQEHVTEGLSLRNKNNLLAFDFFSLFCCRPVWVSVYLGLCLSFGLFSKAIYSVGRACWWDSEAELDYLVCLLSSEYPECSVHSSPVPPHMQKEISWDLIPFSLFQKQCSQSQ